ncbi:hypothetical protein AVEN_3766-1 [Araneus ventricosus]|uniref:Uncharacterized protein n=1 Tax=Araneus ventricosus TaxID=182803 RepID=A0A4Y2NMG4_ARAVE|nr:hypothetical protein AVEN_3766-1 [Araneus ventricosus]
MVSSLQASQEVHRLGPGNARFYHNQPHNTVIHLCFWGEQNIGGQVVWWQEYIQARIRRLTTQSSGTASSGGQYCDAQFIQDWFFWGVLQWMWDAFHRRWWTLSRCNERVIELLGV